MYNKIRFQKDNENQNIGFSDSEILKIRELIDFELPEVYLSFLKIAGKKSNVLNHRFDSYKDLLNMQKEFKVKLKDSDVENVKDQIWCFSNFEEEYFYFENNHKKDPQIFQYSNKLYPTDNGWNHKLGYITKRGNFIEFINYKTQKKYGFTLFENMKNISLLVIYFPFILIIFLLLKISDRLK